MSLDLCAYRALSFDVYGTLIDWEAGIAAVLRPWGRQAGLELDDEALLLAYAAQEAAVERERPGELYPAVLAEAFRRTGQVLGREVTQEWAARLGESTPDWPAFPDSAEALAQLARHYRLIMLTNVHREGFAGSNQHLKAETSAVITAEDVGAYKPAAPHFRALSSTVAQWGLESGDLLHVAQSLFHDHVPARRHGLDSVWINRRHAQPGWGATPEPQGEFTYAAEFPSMAAFASAVADAFGD